MNNKIKNPDFYLQSVIYINSYINLDSIMARAEHGQGRAWPGQSMARVEHGQGRAWPGQGIARAEHGQGRAWPG